MAPASVRTFAAAAFVVVALSTVSTTFAQESSKSEESSLETKEEIKSILSDIERRYPPVAPPVIQRTEERTVPTGVRIAWQPLLLLGVALVLGMLGWVFFRVLAVNARERRIEEMAEAIRRARL
jgi:CHASE3 domain sensor protein